MDIELSTAALAAVILFVAYTVRGIAGFGSGLIGVPLLALSFPIQLVVPIIVLLDFVGSAGQGLKNRKLVSWREQLPLIPFTVIGVTIGLTLLESLASATLALALAIFIMAYAVYQLLPFPDLRGGRVFCAPAGIFGGLVGTVFGTGGPFYIIYLGLRGLDKSALRATFAINFLIDGGIRLAGYTAFGFFDRTALLYVAGALPIVAIAMYVGGRIHLSLSAEIFKRLISALLLLSGVALLLKYA